MSIVENIKPLYTLKGSKIWYSKYGVGKYIGGKIYIHKDYALDVIPTDIFWDAQDALHEAYPDFEYNCICYTSDSIRFDKAPDFDTVKEPYVGEMVSYNFYTGKITKSYSFQIWHHKWLWVKSDYQGFNVQESYDWSKLWLSKLEEPANGSRLKWNKQLVKYGLT